MQQWEAYGRDTLYALIQKVFKKSAEDMLNIVIKKLMKSDFLNISKK